MKLVTCHQIIAIAKLIVCVCVPVWDCGPNRGWLKFFFLKKKLFFYVFELFDVLISKINFKK
jgi:hypothetical protein